MLIPINDDIRYLNFHVLWLKVEWIDLTFMPCEYFGTSLQCDGCQQKFSVRHALECKRGGLVISRHNEIRDELSDLASKAFFPSAVRDEPTIHTIRAAEPRSSPGKPAGPAVKRLFQNNRTEDRGDILVRGLWACGTDCIIDVQVTDLDCKSNRSKDPHKILAQHERAKKMKYLEACSEQRRQFTHFAVSTDGVIGKETRA